MNKQEEIKALSNLIAKTIAVSLDQITEKMLNEFNSEQLETVTREQLINFYSTMIDGFAQGLRGIRTSEQNNITNISEEIM